MSKITLILQHSLINSPDFFPNFVVATVYYANIISCSIKTVRLVEASSLIKTVYEQLQLILRFLQGNIIVEKNRTCICNHPIAFTDFHDLTLVTSSRP